MAARPNPLTGYEPKSLIEVSSERTPINIPSRTGSLDALATTVDASEIVDTTEVGQLTSPLFSQEREVSANPFRHSGVERPMRDPDLFSSIGRPVRETKSGTGECATFSNGKRREFCLNRRSLHGFLEETADRAFQGEFAAQTRCLKRTLNWTEESGKGGLIILLFVKLADSLNPRGWNSIRRINCLIKLKGNRDLEELRRICCVEADRARQLKLDEPSVRQKENPFTVNQLMAQIQELQDKVNFLA